MKIAFVSSEKYKKYESLIEEIVEALKVDSKNSQNIFEVNVPKNTRKKYDLYVVFSDDKEDFDSDVSKLKIKPMLITSNLKSDYISHVITKVTDIVYSKNKLNTIISRINGNLERQKCIVN